jgi:hypothetical protein
MMKQVFDITKASSIDYILGNPPFGLSRDGRIHHDDAQNQVSRHGEKLRGNISSYLLFLSAGFNSLKPSGSMALITPNAWLGIRSAELFRTNLLEENSILRIETNPDKAFEQCSVETITVYLSKKEPQGPISLSKINRVGEVGSEYSTISTTSCLSRPNKTIPLMWNEQFEEIFKEIKLRAKTIGEMGDYFRPFIALQEYSVGQGTPPQTKNCSIIREFHSFTKHSEEWFPFLLGRDVDRFSINWSGQYLHYGPWLAQPCVKGRYQMPRVIIREVTGAKPHLLRSVATSAPLFYNRSLLHILIFPKTINSKTSPEIRANDESALKLAKALSAILNSTIINTFFLFHGRKVQRKLFPKVLSEDLRDIPIPHLFLDGYDDLADVVNNLCGDERDTKIDQIVSEMFKLPETICAQFKEQLR